MPADALSLLLEGEPSPRGWDRLCDLLDRAEPAALPSLLARAEPALAAWPDALREAQGHWLAALLRGEDVVQLELARTLRVRQPPRDRLHMDTYGADNPSEHLGRLLDDPHTWATLVAHPRLRNLTHVELEPTDAEHEDERRVALDWRRASVKLPPSEPGPGPDPRRIRALADARLALRKLDLRGPAGPIPNGPPRRAKGWLARLFGVYEPAPIDEWRALLDGAGRTVDDWTLDRVELGEALLAAASACPTPWRRLDLRLGNDVELERIRDLLRCPCAASLEWLALHHPRPAMIELLGVELAQVRTLALHGVARFDDLWLRSLIARFPGLTALTLGGDFPHGQLRRAHLDELLDPDPTLGDRLGAGLGAQLEALCVHRHEFELVEGLLGKPLPRLRSLELAGGDPEVLAALVRTLPNLERLVIRRLDGLPVALAQALAEAPLRELDLSFDGERAVELDPLLRGACRPQRLRLRGHNKGLVRLRDSPLTAAVEHLTLSPVSPTVVEALLRSTTLTRLQWLRLHGSGAGIRPSMLADHPPPPNLRGLWLDLERLEVDDVDALCRSGWAELDELNFGSFGIDQPEHRLVRDRWLGSTLPAHHKDRAGTGPYGWTVRDYLRLPPYPGVLSWVRRGLARGVYPELEDDLRWRAQAWPEPLRAELLAAIDAAPRLG